jgi:hypothetical protein
MEIPAKIEKCLESEKGARDSYYKSFSDKEAEWVDIFKNWEEIKRDRLLTRAFLRRIYLAYDSERILDKKIGRKRQRSISSDMENIFGQMLRAFLESQKVKGFAVMINDKLGNKEPDILVTKNTKPTCVIELKSDLGYSRKEWSEILNKRLSVYTKIQEDKIQEKNFFVVILTAGNWKTKNMDLKDELRKWKGKKGNFVFLIKDPKIHPNPVKLSEGEIDEATSVFNSLDSLNRIVSEPALEEIFSKILSSVK